MELYSFLQTRDQTSETKTNEKCVEPVKEKTIMVGKVRGSYYSYTPQQTQELLDLVIEQGMSARQE
jgi:hypothetical protein